MDSKEMQMLMEAYQQVYAPQEETLEEKKIAHETGKKVMPSAKERSALAKKARAGEDIGKPGKGFEKVAAKAAKRYGSKKAGERVAAAAMFKAQAHKEEFEIDEAVKGEPSERRKDLAAERRAGHRPLPAKEGERYASYKLAQMAYAKRKRMEEEVEQLDEISLKTKMKAYAASRDVDADYAYGSKVHSQGDRIKANIVKKHGEKAGEHAERHAEVSNFGRGTPRAKPRIEKNRTYRTTKSGKMHGQDQAKLKRDLEYKRSSRNEEFELDIFDVVLEFLQAEGFAETLEEAEWMMANELDAEDIDAILEDAKYDRNRKRAAQRAQARNEARARGQTGNVPGVGYVSPRPERATYTDSAGVVRHHSGARMPK